MKTKQIIGSSLIFLCAVAACLACALPKTVPCHDAAGPLCDNDMNPPPPFYSCDWLYWDTSATVWSCLEGYEYGAEKCVTGPNDNCIWTRTRTYNLIPMGSVQITNSVPTLKTTGSCGGA